MGSAPAISRRKGAPGSGPLASRCNLLLLDEPTNHLDLEAREALEGTLVQYPGSIVFVSHDRSFVETLADEVIELGKEAVSREEDAPVRASLMVE